MTTDRPRPTRLVATFEPMPDCEYPMVAYRRMLKAMLRRLKLRCVDLSESNDSQPRGATGQPPTQTEGKPS